MGRPKAKRTASEAKRLKRLRSRAAAYYASAAEVHRSGTGPVIKAARVEQEVSIAPTQTEYSDGPLGVDEPESDCAMEPLVSPDDGHDRPGQDPQNDEAHVGRDVANMKDFDWNGASNFAAHPAALAGLSRREEKAFLCYNSPIMTRRLWDDFIKPLVDTTIDELVPPGLQTWKLKSFKGVRTQLRSLAPGMQPVYIDACRNHCCVFNNPVATRGEKCRHCKADRRNHKNKPFATTAIFPLKNLLRAQILDENLKDAMMEYRSSYQKANETESVPEMVEDFWDGEEPRRMMRPGGLLESPTVIALTITGDAAEYSKSPKESVTPYMALNQNLPPSKRYKNELVLALHAGEAKDESVWEAIFNAMKQDDDPRSATGPEGSLGLYYGKKQFKFQVCMGTGDYPFAASCLGLCAQAGRCSCRICEVAGYRVSAGYYLVHEKPYDDQEQLEMQFPFEPIQYGHNTETLRTWDNYKRTIAMAGSLKTIRLKTGISAHGSLPVVVRHLEPTGVPFHRLIPIDPMHAMALNVIKLMMQFVTGKDSNFSTMDFCLSDNNMKAFFSDLIGCTKDIPEELMRRPMLDFRKSSARSEHFVAIGRLAPILLAGRLPVKYMGAITHASYLLDELARLRVNRGSLEELEERVVLFQNEFYENWYGAMALRVQLCKTYFHCIAHLPDAIRAWGPPFIFSQYAMERLNGRVIKMARANAKTPIESSANRVTREAQVRRIMPQTAMPDTRRGPILGLRLRISSDHFILTKAEKRALETYLRTSDEQIPDSVSRYARFYFEYQLDYHKVSASQYRSTEAIKRECRYAYCSDLDSFCDVLSLFEFKGRELAFVNLMKIDKFRWDDFENEYIDNWPSCWGSRITVINCNDITNSVAFIENSKYPSRRFLIRNLRVYNGDRYEEDPEDVADD